MIVQNSVIMVRYNLRPKMLKLRSILQYQPIFSLFQKLIAADRIKHLLVQNTKLKPGFKVLDVGCGFGNLLEYLPKDISYVGVDISQNYINYAKKRYTSRGRFICADVTRLDLKREKFDVIFISSLFHHLPDNEVEKLLESLLHLIKKESVLVSADSVYLKNQSFLSRFITSSDRGKHVRNKERYLDLTKKYFSKVNYKIVSNLLNIPINLIFIWMRL